MKGVIRACVSAGSNQVGARDRKSTRLNSSHSQISYAVFCLKKKKNQHQLHSGPRLSPDRIALSYCICSICTAIVRYRLSSNMHPTRGSKLPLSPGVYLTLH